MKIIAAEGKPPRKLLAVRNGDVLYLRDGEHSSKMLYTNAYLQAGNTARVEELVTRPGFVGIYEGDTVTITF